jgi:hypothetical protein
MSDDAIAALRRADDELADARAGVEEIGRESIEAVADAHDDLTSLFARYESRATGSGDFAAFVEFEEKLSTLVEDLPDDLPEREAFEGVEELLDKRRLSEADFERARDALAPVEAVLGRRERHREARRGHREARRTVGRELSAVEERIDDLQRVARLGAADLNAPVENLREPLEAYNDAVREAFEAFEADSSARDVLDFVATTRSFPLVPFRQPPEDLRAYVERSDAGERTVPELLDFADYSTAKLSHHVADPRQLKRRVATNRTYLERLDAGPLTLEWPPESAEALRWRIEELIAVCNRFASNGPISRLREVRERARNGDEYERLRNAARAREELTPEERDRLASGVVEEELEAARDARERLEAALEEFSER